MYGHVRRHLLVVLVLSWGCLWTWWGMLLTHAVHRMASHRKEFPGPKPRQCRSWEPLLWKPLSFHVPIYYVSNVFLIFNFFFPLQLFSLSKLFLNYRECSQRGGHSIIRISSAPSVILNGSQGQEKVLGHSGVRPCSGDGGGQISLCNLIFSSVQPV